MGSPGETGRCGPGETGAGPSRPGAGPGETDRRGPGETGRCGDFGGFDRFHFLDSLFLETYPGEDLEIVL